MVHDCSVRHLYGLFVKILPGPRRVSSLHCGVRSGFPYHRGSLQSYRLPRSLFPERSERCSWRLRSIRYKAEQHRLPPQQTRLCAICRSFSVPLTGALPPASAGWKKGSSCLLYFLIRKGSVLSSAPPCDPHFRALFLNSAGRNIILPALSSGRVTVHVIEGVKKQQQITAG